MLIFNTMFFYSYDTKFSRKRYREIIESMDSIDDLEKILSTIKYEPSPFGMFGEIVQKPSIFLERGAGDSDDFANFCYHTLSKMGYVAFIFCVFSPTSGGYATCAYIDKGTGLLGHIGSAGHYPGTDNKTLKELAYDISKDWSNSWILKKSYPVKKIKKPTSFPIGQKSV